MGTDILKSFGTLQSELEQARDSLKGVDENIKRLIGRDPSELQSRPGVKRGPQPEENRNRPHARGRNRENDEPAAKRRNGATSVFKRLSERPVHYEEETVQHPQMISKVIVTPREVPSRQEALAAQNSDEKSKARNRRMFGALLGTLQKFQQEETKLKQKEDMRAQLEKKIEEHEIKEKAEIRRERQELFLNRKKKQAEIKMIEFKMLRMKEYARWEESQKPKMCFIQTKAKPHIYYLPRRMNEQSKQLLEAGRADIEKMLDKKRQEVFDELQHIEDRVKRNFEPRKKPEESMNEQENENNIEMEVDQIDQSKTDGDDEEKPNIEIENVPTETEKEEEQNDTENANENMSQEENIEVKDCEASTDDTTTNTEVNQSENDENK